MSSTLILAAIVAAIALTYWRPLRRLRTALGVDHLVSTGHAFLVLGFVLGMILGERPTPLADDLGPVVAFVAGWVGFATGMRFELRVLRRIPPRAFSAALLPAAAAAVAVGSIGAALLFRAGVPRTEAIAAALVLAGAASSSGPTLAAVLRARRAGRAAHARPVLRMIELSAGVDDILVIVLAMLAFAMFRKAPEPVDPVWLIGGAVGGGALLGCVTWLFLGGRATDDERLLLGLAMLAFIAGFAGWLHLSPAGVAAIAAMVLVNLPGERMAQLLHAVRRVERPAVVILMTVIGFHLTGMPEWIFLPLLAAMTVGRFAAKHVAGELVAGPIPGAPGLVASRRWAYGLATQGTLGLMVALDFFHVWHDDLARSLLGAVAVAGLLNELVAPWLLLRLLRGLGRPAPEATVAGKEAA